MKYLVSIECTDAGGFEIGMAISQMGYRPLFLLNPNSYKADLGVSLQNFEFLNVDTQSSDEIIKALYPLRDEIAGITTLVDSRIPIAAEVALKMGVPGPDPACMILNDKAAVAKICPEYSLQTILLSTFLRDSQNEVDNFLKEKVVAKKRVGCGAVGIQFLFTEQEKSNFIRHTINLNEWIFQEYFDGSLYSMEGWVENSGITFLGWTSRRKIHNTETEFRFEAYESMPFSITEYAQSAIQQLFSRSDFKRGWFHIEFLVNQSKTRAVIVDANIGRVGGAMLPHVLAMSLSKSPAQIYQHAIEIQLFGSSNISINPKTSLEKIYKCICFGTPTDAVIQDVVLPESPLKAKGLRITRILGSGDYVSQIGQDDWSWVGFVAGAEADVDHYASKIQIKLQDGTLYSAAF